MAAKCTIVNAEGYTLRALPNNKFNDATKVQKTWTFSVKGVDLDKGVYSESIKKALDQLEAAGFKNLKVVACDDAGDAPKEYQEKAATATEKTKVTKGKSAPKDKELAAFIAEETKGLSAEEKSAVEDFWSGVNDKCKMCSRGCRQSTRVTLISCPQYTREAA